MANNNFLTFASAAGALVESDAAYASDAARLLGFQNGVADPAHVNKVWRQGAAGSSVIGQVVADHAGVDANDDGDIQALKANFRAGVAAMLASAAFGQDTSSTANVIQVALSPAPPTLSSFRSLFVRVANTNTGPVTIALNALGSKTATRHDGTPLQAKDLPAGQVAHFIYDSTLGQWVLAGAAASEVPKIPTTDVIIHINLPANGANDSAADGSATAPFATLAAAANFAQQRFSFGGFRLILKLDVPGNYTAPGLLPNIGGTIVIQGDVNNQDAYVLQGTGPSGGGGGVIFMLGGSYSFLGVRIQNTGAANHTLNSSSAASVSCQNVTLDAGQNPPFFHAQAANAGQIFFGSGCKSNGSAAGLAAAVGAGTVRFGSNFLVANGPTWSFAGAYAGSGYITLDPGVTLSGPAAGTRYNAANYGVIQTYGQGANAIPGNVAGTVSNGLYQ
jgi:hypothetical protein